VPFIVFDHYIPLIFSIENMSTCSIDGLEAPSKHQHHDFQDQSLAIDVV